jgi:hypothetical protein
MNARTLYLIKLLSDAKQAMEEQDLPVYDYPDILAAILISDAINGLRKAVVNRES